MTSTPGISHISEETPSKILMLVIDGLGGLPNPKTKLSELETAIIPNLDRLASESNCGLTTPVGQGITPGSGPGHLALFGYDPQNYDIGRGVLEALGIGLKLEESDIVARGNFVTLDSQGNIIDRRAGRISTAEATRLCATLNSTSLEGANLEIHSVKEHRFVFKLNGSKLSASISDSDPQKLGVAPLTPKPLDANATHTAKLVEQFLAAAKESLKERESANMVLLRGFSKIESIPSIKDMYQLDSCVIAAYPMYKGLAQMIGMNVIDAGDTFESEMSSLHSNFSSHSFIYLHFKAADGAGEDGNFNAKVKALEYIDKFIPDLIGLNPDVLIVAGDHSTPAIIGGHSWHPVPFILHSKWTQGDGIDAFTEKGCRTGTFGNISATNVMSLAMAHAGKLTKFGA